MNGEYIDILLIGVIAVFLIFRLSKVMGTKVDDNKNVLPDFKAKVKLGFAEDAKPEDKKEEANDPIAIAFTDMKSVDKKVTQENFLNGAKKAFEVIITAFAKGDIDTLKMLVDPIILDKFVKAIQGYKDRGEKIEQTLIGFKNVKILKADLVGKIAKVTVEFETEQSKVVTDADGKVLEGDAVMISTVIDIWEFERNLTSRSPNWMLISAKGGN